MSLNVYCQSSQHSRFTNGNGYNYGYEVPTICRDCGDPFIDKSIYSEALVEKGLQAALKSKQSPVVFPPTGDIVLESMYFTDQELIDIIQRDKRRDVIKASLAAKLLSLRSAVRPLGDFEWKDPNKLINAAWVAGHINTEIKWLDYWCRGYDPMSIRA